MPRGDFWPTWRERLAAGAVADERGCLIWQRAKNSRGYGVIYMDGKVRLAHRVAFFARHGRWPNPELVLDHECEVKACVNADHLRESTNVENIRRAVTPPANEAQARRRAGWRRADAKRRGTYRFVEGR